MPRSHHRRSHLRARLLGPAGAVALAVPIVGVAATAVAVPTTVNFTGRLADDEGVINGVVDLGVSLYDDPESDAGLVWEESHPAADVFDGLIFLQLGSVDPAGNPLDDRVFDGRTMYLEITVDGEVLDPRVPVGSVPYALRAGSAERLGDLTPSDVALADHTHPGGGHTHSEYALTTHNHDGRYALFDHLHNYADPAHLHDNRYEMLGHVHSQYSLIGHTHSGLAPDFSGCTKRVGACIPLVSGGLATAEAACIGGETAVTGGATFCQWDSSTAADMYVSETFPAFHRVKFDVTTAGNSQPQAWVLCCP